MIWIRNGKGSRRLSERHSRIKTSPGVANIAEKMKKASLGCAWKRRDEREAVKCIMETRGQKKYVLADIPEKVSDARQRCYGQEGMKEGR